MEVKGTNVIVVSIVPSIPFNFLSIRFVGLKWALLWGEPFQFFFGRRIGLLYLFHDGLEHFGSVHGQVGEHLAVDFDTSLVDAAHELAVVQSFEACGSVDTLNPQSAEIALLSLAVAIGIGETLFPGVLGNGPHVLACAEIAAC